LTRLQRHIGLFALTLYGIGDILGSGIYGLVGKAAGHMGNLLWLGFLVSFFVALMTGLSYAALSSRHHRAAGSSYILWKAFGSPFLAYIAGLATLCSGLTSMATASRIFAGYLHGLIPHVPVAAGVVGFGLLMTGIVWSGIRHSLWVNAVCTVVELSGLLLVIAAGVSFLGSTNLLDTSTIPTGPTSLSPSLVLSGAVLTFYSFIGFEDLINVSEEVVRPERTVPTALLISLLIASFIYMLVSVIAVSVIPAAQLSQSSQPLVDVMRVAWPSFPHQVFSVIALFAVANTALLNFIMSSRLIYGMGNIGLLPKWVSHVHAHRKTPTVSIAITVILLLGLALVADVTTLARATSLFILLVFLGMNLSLWRFQRRTRHASWNIPQWIPLLGFAGTLAMLAHAEQKDIFVAGSLLAGIIVLYFVRKPTVEQIQKLDS